MNHRKPLSLLAALVCALTLVPTAAALEKPLTQSQSDLTAEGTLPAGCAESTLGDFLCDAALEAVGADIAILPAGVMTGTLEKGAVFQSDLERVVPTDAPLVTAQLTAADLAALLEQGVSRLTRNESEQIDIESSAWDGFPQTGGITWEYDVSAPTGERLQYIRLNDEELDLSDTAQTYTVTSTAALFDGSLGYAVRSFEETDMTLRQAAHDYCAARDSVSAPSTRATAIGTASYPIAAKFPVLAIAAAGILIALIASIPKWKEKKHFSFEGK